MMKTTSTKLKNKTACKGQAVRTDLIIRRFGALLQLVCTHKGGNLGITQCLEEYHNRVRSREKSRGPDEAAAHFKAIYQIAVKIATGREFKPLPFTKSDRKTGIPQVLKPLVPYLLSDDENDKRVGLTISRIYTCIFSKREPDLQPIIDGPKLSGFNMESWTKFVKNKVPPLSDHHWDPTQFHMTSKAGPNGLALISSDLDGAALHDCAPHLLTNIESLNPNLRRHIDEQVSWIAESRRRRKLRVSKLSVIREGGAKNRVIAVGDYYSQEALKRLNHHLFKWLGSQEEDGTFNQGNSAKLVRRALNKGKPVYCFDLSNATDRFPLSIQKEVIREIIGDKADD